MVAFIFTVEDSENDWKTSSVSNPRQDLTSTTSGHFELLYIIVHIKFIFSYIVNTVRYIFIKLAIPI